MITLEALENSVKFTFTDSDHYLYGDGIIEVPKNSLALVTDSSEMFTFKKAATNDPFISAKYSDVGMTKEELEAFFKENMVGGEEVDPEEVQALIDQSISGISATSMSAVTYVNSWASANVNNQKVGFWWEKADGSSGNTTVLSAKTNGDISLIDNEIKLNSAFTSTLITDAQYVGSANTINFLNSSGETIATIDTSDFVIDGMVEDVRIEEISGATYLVIDFNTASGKQDIQIPLTEIFDPSNFYNKSEIDGIVSGINEDIATKADSSAVTQEISAAVSGKQDTLIAGDGITISGNEISWSADKEEVIAKTFFQLNDKIGDLNETTDSLGDKINTKQDLLTAGEGIDITDNVISVAITSSVTSASTDSEIPTAKAVFDAVGQGGGATYSAGTNISIDTANTISCTLPISRGSNERSIIIGGSGTATQPLALAKGVASNASAVGSTCFGFNSSARGNYSFVCGEYLETSMESSAVFGKYNTNIGLSLFSVGNGTSSSAKHNAFEIRENGDIYISSGGTDIKLQDNLGGGGIDSGTVQSMIDESISGKVETSAITSSITSASTDTEIPSAKAVYDALEGQGGGLDEDFLQANANALYELKQEGKAINERFDNYYTKTASDGRYASNASIKKAYYDKAYVDDKLLAISASLNELNDRIAALESQLNNN